jgi:hypothetical protein
MPVRRKRERCFKFMINQKECINEYDELWLFSCKRVNRMSGWWRKRGRWGRWGRWRWSFISQNKTSNGSVSYNTNRVYYQYSIIIEAITAASGACISSI